MKLSERSKRLLIVSVLCVVIATIVYFSPDVKTMYYNNYKEIAGLGYPYKLPAFIKKDSCKNIQIEHLNVNNLGDVLCYCTYGKGDGLMIWEMKEFGSVPLSEIKLMDSTIKLDNHFVFKKIKSLDIRFPCLAMVMEPTLDTARNLTVYVQDDKRDTTVITPNYIYCYLNFTAMKFYRNNKFNFQIAKYPSVGCDFIICNYKRSLYMMYFYSLNFDPIDPSPVRPGDLLRILDL